jgi:hypothetical protein
MPVANVEQHLEFAPGGMDVLAVCKLRSRWPVAITKEEEPSEVRCTFATQ